MIRPCPHCQKPLDIPQPTPMQIHCTHCKSVIHLKGIPAATSQAVTANPPVPSPRPAPPSTTSTPLTADDSRRSMVMLLGLLGGVSLLGCLSVVGVALVLWLVGGKEKKLEAKPADVALVKPKGEEAVVLPIPKTPEAPREPVMSPEIRAAIDRGTAHLKKRLQEKRNVYTGRDYGGYRADFEIGATALAGLALLEAKTPPDDPTIQQVLSVVRNGSPQSKLIYTLGSVLFFLNRLHDVEPLGDADRQLLRTLALRLVAGQVPNGYWSYNNPPITPKAEEALLRDLRANTYTPRGRISSHASHSMTQFALLALWGSRRHDIPISPVLLVTTRRFRMTQDADGTWPYFVDGRMKCYCDSNTCAGLIALAMEETLHEEQKRERDPNDRADDQRDKAFAHLAKAMDGVHVNTNQQPFGIGTIFKADSWGDYYFLWCLERVAVIYDKKEIGGKDWYGWGSQILLQNQKQDGSWQDLHGDVADTCFAVLFLTRANLAKDLT